MKNTPHSEFDIISAGDLPARLQLDRTPPTARLFGLDLANTTMAAMADHIASRALIGAATTVNFANAHCVNVARRDAVYRRVLASSDLCLPDGVGVAIAARWHDRELGDNLNGTDLFPELCSRAANMGLGIYLLGGYPDVAAAAAQWAYQTFPGLKIAGHRDGFFDQARSDEVIAQINASGAHMLFVGMGVPLQEKWIAEHRHRLTVPVILGVGGLFDYYSGRIPRAPLIVRKLRSEWMWRLAMEPRRMAQRYLIGNATFLAHAARSALVERKFFARIDQAAKRATDIVGAVCALVLLAPLLLLVALAICCEDRGPALFRQTRIGSDGRPFTMLKFRSMYTDAEARRQHLLAQSDRHGAAFKMRNDPRITRVGRVIRRLSIDELPQLFNVLGGTMSLVGPRPALACEVVGYRGRTWDRLRGKPGITCTWQVKGRAEIPFRRQALMDRAYLRRRGFGLDLRLLARTVPAVAGGRGAY